MGKKGGGTNIQPAVDATRESNELLKQIYEESVQRGEPYYQGGLSGFNTLLDYMGLQGGSQATEQQIRDELTPYYTTQNQGGGLYTDASGAVYGREALLDRYATPSGSGYRKSTGNAAYESVTPSLDRIMQLRGLDQEGALGFLGYNQLSPETTIDAGGLDAAIQARLSSQTTPEYFGSLLTPFGEEQFQEDPSYAFRQAEGQKALERQLAAQGKTFSPEAAKALMGYNQGLASTEYQSAYNRYNQDQSNVFNRLASIAGIGQQQNAINAGLGQNYSTQVGNNLTGLANTQMAAQQADVAAKQSMFNTLLGTGAMLGGAYLGNPAVFASDVDLKENIEHVGNENGFNTYTFNYKGDDVTYKGVMAQEVMETRPDAVAVINGHYAVNYDKIGVKMEVV